jgi:hypothetical protein
MAVVFDMIDASLEERFWRNVHCPMHSECWLWLAYTNPRGYGMIGRGRRGEGTILAHRLSWEIHHGPIPDGLCVLHRCNNPPCVFPGHLFLGTRADNNRHASECRITPRGEAHWNSKLTEEQVRTIRAMPESQSKIAKLFGIGRIAVQNIKSGKTWMWL